MTKCNCCGRDQELRMGFCFDCVEAESIIEEGKDMYDRSFKGNIPNLSKSMNKLRFLVKKGWYPNINPERDRPVKFKK